MRRRIIFLREQKTFTSICANSAPYLNSRSSIQQMQKIHNPREAGMTIRFADGTHIEIAATAFDDFIKHDLKWAEFVHGRASVKKLACNDSRKLVPAAATLGRSVHPCPAGGC
jgi:hypothetical protein